MGLESAIGASTDGEESAFEAALRLPLSDLAYPNGALLVEKRINFLEKLSKLGLELESEIGPNAKAAIDATRAMHSLCNDIPQAHSQLSPLLNLGEARLIVQAKLALDVKYEKTPTLKVLEERCGKEVRQQVMGLMVRALEEGSKLTVRELIDANYADATENSIAMFQSSMLLNQKEMLSHCIKVLRTVMLQSLIWRGVFYAAVIQAEGSELKNKMMLDKVAAVMPQLTRQILGLMPILGHWFAALDIIESLRELYRARQSVEGPFDDLVQTARSAKKYLFAYSEALQRWGYAANQIVFGFYTHSELLRAFMSGDDDEALQARIDSIQTVLTGSRIKHVIE